MDIRHPRQCHRRQHHDAHAAAEVPAIRGIGVHAEIVALAQREHGVERVDRACRRRPHGCHDRSHSTGGEPAFQAGYLPMAAWYQARLQDYGGTPARPAP